MEILPDKYFEKYKQQIQIDLNAALKEVEGTELSLNIFTFYTSVAVIFSSRIEGEKMEIDSYVKHKMQNIEYLPELVEKPNDLFQAYLFAKENKLSKKNFLQCHTFLSTHLLTRKWQGSYRQNEMLIMEHKTGKIQYEAAPIYHCECRNEKTLE